MSGKRGPKPDPNQAAKGFPGHRRAKAVEAAKAAAHIAALLAPAPVDGVELPVMLRDPKYAGAAHVWRKLAPELRRTHRLPREAELYLVQVCVYAQEWIAATDNLHTNGFTQDVATVAGGKMERRRPATFDRQQAYSNLAELSVKFGLTPNDMYSLFKGQAGAASNNPGLFGDERQAPAAPSADGELPLADAPAASRIGSLKARRSAPPGETVN